MLSDSSDLLKPSNTNVLTITKTIKNPLLKTSKKTSTLKVMTILEEPLPVTVTSELMVTMVSSALLVAQSETTSKTNLFLPFWTTSLIPSRSSTPLVER